MARDYQMIKNINEFLSIRLVDGHTEIFVGDKLIQKCHLLIMNIPTKETNRLKQIDSVDELVEYAEENRLTQDLILEDGWRRNGFYEVIKELTQEEEFWAHSSTIQAWTESGYDTRLLDMRLAFPILKELTRIGDSVARRIFKDEIFKRMKSGYPQVLIFLAKEGFLNFLTEEEQRTLFQEINLKKVLNVFSEAKYEKYNHIGYFLDNLSEEQINMLLTESDPSGIKQLELVGIGIINLPKPLLRYTDVKDLNLCKNNLTSLPENIDTLNNLKYLDLGYNKLKILPKSIGNLRKLVHLDIRGNLLEEIPDTIGNLTDLIELWIGGNKLSILPPSFKNLKKVEDLRLRKNNFSKVPTEIFQLKGLRTLSLGKNNIEELPQKLKWLILLKDLILPYNKLEILPETIGNLTNLEEIYLGNNLIREIPISIGNLKKLKKLSLENNNLDELPDSISSLVRLEKLDLSFNPLRSIPKGVFRLPNLQYLHLPTDSISTPNFFLLKYEKRMKSKNNIWYARKNI